MRQMNTPRRTPKKLISSYFDSFKTRNAQSSKIKAVQMWKNTEQKNYECEHFLRSVKPQKISLFYLKCIAKFSTFCLNY